MDSCSKSLLIVSGPLKRGIFLLNAFGKEALLKYRIKLLFFFFLNSTNQLNTMKGAVEKLLCNFRKPCNPDLTVELARCALSPNLLSVHLQGGKGEGRRCGGTYLPPWSLLDIPWMRVSRDPMQLGRMWGARGSTQPPEVPHPPSTWGFNQS